jgi:predicted TIM-barrel fold metal-dependent hydrolase
MRRRHFIKGLAALGASSVFAGDALRAQRSDAPGRPIDVHFHYMSPNFHAAISRRNAVTPVANNLDRFKDPSADKLLEQMDQAGIGTAMLSPYVGNTGFWFGDVEEARRLARDLNEWSTQTLVNGHKGRFGLFAALPMPDVEGTLREIDYAFNTLKVDGVAMTTNYGNKYLGDESFAPVFDALNAHNAVVYTHPVQADCCRSPLPGVGPQTLEYPTDTARTILSVIQGKGAARTPNVRYIFSHAGGTIVSLAQRILGAQVTAASLAQPTEPNSRLHHIRRFYYDTAGSANPVQMGSLKLLVPASQIVLGSDFPLLNLKETVDALQTSGFTPNELRGVYRDNALRMLPGHAQLRLGS